MSFFQNVFNFEFRATLFGADRKFQTTYKVPPNPSANDYLISATSGPFDLSSEQSLTINYAFDPDLRNYSSIVIDVSSFADDASQTKAYEILKALNDNSTFAGYFVAKLNSDKVLITVKGNKPNFRVYISNTGAETVLKFNNKAPVYELPTYFEKYSIENRFNYPDLGPNRLILLNPAVSEDADIITAAGFNPSSPTPDWKLLKGTNDAFWFYKRTYADGKLSTEIKYQAGSVEGDLAKKTHYVYDDSDLVEVLEVPYVLQSSDLSVPPT